MFNRFCGTHITPWELGENREEIEDYLLAVGMYMSEYPTMWQGQQVVDKSRSEWKRKALSKVH